MLLLRANVLAKGHSGVRPELLELLVDMLNAGVHPIIPAKGSVGASGDLAPLAHQALVVIGEGEAIYKGQRLPGLAALTSAGLQPIQLAAKEGLALLNGTQAMTATGALTIQHARYLTATADLAGAMSLEALKGTPVAFDERIHNARPHHGQMASAANLSAILEDSEIRQSHIAPSDDPRVQDAYCLRCMPQVHGAVRDVLIHVARILETESGSATDNPLVFVDDKTEGRSDMRKAAAPPQVVSGGNFHGAPLAYAFDYAAIALTDLASISERRIDRLINPDINEGLPAFLCTNAGLSSGYMIAHVTARRPSERMQSPRSSLQHRLGPNLGRQRRSRLHGHDRRTETPPGHPQSRTDLSHRNDVRRPGTRLSSAPQTKPCRSPGPRNHPRR